MSHCTHGIATYLDCIPCGRTFPPQEQPKAPVLLSVEEVEAFRDLLQDWCLMYRERVPEGVPTGTNYEILAHCLTDAHEFTAEHAHSLLDKLRM